MEPASDRSALDVMPGLGMGKAQYFLTVSGRPLLISRNKKTGDMFSSSSHCFLLQGNQNRIYHLMPIAVTACKVFQWVQQCCSMPWHMTSMECLFSPQGVWCKKCPHAETLPSTLLFYGNGPGRTHKFSESTAFHLGNTYTIAKTVMLSILFPKWRVCTSCFVFHQAGQVRRQSTHPQTPIWLNRDGHLVCLMASHLIEVTPCSFTASLYIIVAIMNLLLDKYLLQQLEQTDAAVCPASNGGWGAHKYSACCWHIPALIPDLRTQRISVLCIFRRVGLTTCWCHNDIYTIGTQRPSDFLSSTEETGIFSHHPR